MSEQREEIVVDLSNGAIEEDNPKNTPLLILDAPAKNPAMLLSLSLSLSLSKFEELGFQILIGRLRFILSVSEDVDGTVWPQR